jgi:pimeloyl-ACP methyl ester carboxylesterase
MAVAEGTIALGDGRRLGYAEWGTPEGTPVVGLPGTPNSRLAHLGAAAPRAAGVRLLMVDRPGLGLSDELPERTLLDWADDMRELADALGVGRFAVFGVSGGGPHAAACAFALPDRVTLLGLVSTVGPVWDVPALAARLPRGRRELVDLARRDPLAARERVRQECEADLARLARDPDRWLDDWAQTAPPPDRDAVSDAEIRAMYIGSVGEAGLDAYAREVELIWLTSWGFDPSDIAVPTTLWHGGLDAAVPVAVARALAAAIPGCEPRIDPQAGHLLVHERAHEILRTLSARGG